eukprot:4630540-Lingulodinium_polyedra.AAC.1
MNSPRPAARAMPRPRTSGLPKSTMACRPRCTGGRPRANAHGRLELIAKRARRARAPRRCRPLGTKLLVHNCFAKTAS